MKKVSVSLDENSGLPSLLISSGTPKVAKYLRNDLIKPEEPEFAEFGLTLITSGQLLNLLTVTK